MDRYTLKPELLANDWRSLKEWGNSKFTEPFWIVGTEAAIMMIRLHFIIFPKDPKDQPHVACCHNYDSHQDQCGEVLPGRIFRRLRPEETIEFNN